MDNKIIAGQLLRLAKALIEPTTAANKVSHIGNVKHDLEVLEDSINDAMIVAERLKGDIIELGRFDSGNINMLNEILNDLGRASKHFNKISL